MKRYRVQTYKWSIPLLLWGLMACGGGGDGGSSTPTPQPTPTNSAPTISGTPLSEINSGDNYTFTPTASDADGDTLTFSISNQPSWANFNSATGGLIGTPSDSDVGLISNIQISVSDGTTTSSLSAFSIDVLETNIAINTPPTIMGSPALTATVGSVYTFLPNASDADGDTLSFSIANQPSWTSFDQTIGLLSGTPQIPNIGTNNDIEITVNDGSDSAILQAFTITVVANINTTDTDNDGLTDAEEVTIGTNPSIQDTDGDGFLDKEEVDNWDQFSGTHLRFNPLVADVPRLRIQRLGRPVIQLYATTEESGEITEGMSEESVDEIQTITDRGREEVNVVEEQHAVNVNAEVKKSGPVTSGSVEASYDYNHTDTTTETNYWNESTVETNRQASENYYETIQSETVTTTGGEIKVLMGLANDGDVSYTLNNMNVSAYMEDSERPGDLVAVGTLVFEGDLSFTPSPLGKGTEPTDDDYTAFNFVYTAENNPEEISRILENSNQLVFEATNLSLTGQRADVDLNLAAQNVRARTAEVIIDFGDNLGYPTERYRVAIDNGTSETLSFEALMAQRLNFSYEFSSESFPGFTGNRTGLTSLRTLSMNSSTNSYWLILHTFTPVDSPIGTTESVLYNILNEDYSASDIEIRKGDTLHLVYITDSDLDGLSDRLEIIEGTDLNIADTDEDGLDDAFEKYGWYSNLDQVPCDEGEELFLVFSNPLLEDTDGDGTNDGEEFNTCSNPEGDLSVEAGEDKLVSVGEAITLEAEPANFRDRTSLSYIWTQTAGISVGSLANTASISFNAPSEVSNLKFEVTAKDTEQEDESALDTISVFVANNKDTAVFVDADFGHDFNNTGKSPEQAFKTLERGLEVSSSGLDIYLNTPDSSFYESADTIILPATTNLYGGFDTDWIHDPDSSPTPILVNHGVAILLESFDSKVISGVSIEAQVDESSESNSYALFASNGNNLELDRVLLRSADLLDSQITTDENAASSYGAFITGIERLDVRSSSIIAGQGASGVKGGEGSEGDKGDNGSTGSSSRTGGSGGTGHNGENGGKGGTAEDGVVVCRGGNSGSDGDDSGSIDGGSGGKGASASLSIWGVCSTTRYSGGSVSTRGSTGTQGTGGNNSTTFSAGIFVPSDGQTSGGQGVGGAGGGGGGSGAGVDYNYGGGGGGGGEGGEGGEGGDVGKGAGGSFGLVLYAVKYANIGNSQFESSTGGAGGGGGSGGQGGDGGSGGSGGDSGARQGGSGGSGSPGGYGGAGGGGSGGPVAGIVALSTDLIDIANSSLVTGNAGNGSTPNKGQGGWNYGIFIDDATIGANTNNTFQLGLSGNDAQTAAEINP